jgi:biopolymer transport protein ExbD
VGKNFDEEVPEPDLVPIMNLVMLLIPFLLMASAFFEVAVINVSAPKVASGPAPEDTPKDDKPKLNLTVVISKIGFKVCAHGGCLGPGGARAEKGAASGPSAGGEPTFGLKSYTHECGEFKGDCILPMQNICATNGSRPHDLPYTERLKRNLDTGGRNRKDCPLPNGSVAKFDVCKDEATDCRYDDYDYAGLRKLLTTLKDNAEQEDKVMIMADEGIPFGVIVGVMDAARETISETGKKRYLFNIPVLSPGFQ